jgi:hypothetical protein
MKFHAETLKGHGLYLTMHDGNNRVLASVVVKGTFTERNIDRMKWNLRGYNFARSAFQQTLNFLRA